MGHGSGYLVDLLTITGRDPFEMIKGHPLGACFKGNKEQEDLEAALQNFRQNNDDMRPAATLIRSCEEHILADTNQSPRDFASVERTHGIQSIRPSDPLNKVRPNVQTDLDDLKMHQEINLENRQRIQSMSEAEIVEAQEWLRETLPFKLFKRWSTKKN